MNKTCFLTTVCIIISVLSFAEKPKKKDLSPPWYKRFVGTIGNESGIIHIQKSYKNSIIMIYTSKQDFQFNDTEITFSPDKIEAEKKDYQKRESKIFRGIIQNETLTGSLVLPSGSILSLNLKEDYTNATKIKLYEYSYITEINYETALGMIKYHYYYSLSTIPEYAVQDFEKGNIGRNISKRSSEGLKGEIKDLENSTTRYLSTEDYSCVVFNQNDILILQHKYYTYEGGAHGMYGSSYIHYDLQKRKPIKAENIFVKGYEKTLAPLLLKKAKELDYLLPLSDTIEVSENFLLTPTEIIFIYQPYEIAPYAYGIVELKIPYHEIKELLIPGSILRRIMKK